MLEHKKVLSFMDLIVWQKAHIIVIEVYKQTKIFPPEELYALVNQIRRAVVSVTSNIAEGFCRATAKDKIYFYSVALSSVTELQNQLLIAKDLKYIKEQKYSELFNSLVEIHKMINGLIGSATSRN